MIIETRQDFMDYTGAEISEEEWNRLCEIHNQHVIFETQANDKGFMQTFADMVLQNNPDLLTDRATQLLSTLESELDIQSEKEVPSNKKQPQHNWNLAGSPVRIKKADDPLDGERVWVTEMLHDGTILVAVSESSLSMPEIHEYLPGEYEVI